MIARKKILKNFGEISRIGTDLEKMCYKGYKNLVRDVGLLKLVERDAKNKE